MRFVAPRADLLLGHDLEALVGLAHGTFARAEAREGVGSS